VATTVIMPALGMAQATGRVIRWLKGPGAQVAKGEPLIEIETDKATVEVESPASGILTQITAREGDEVPVGQAIALIGESPEASGTRPSSAEGAPVGASVPPAASAAGAPEAATSPPSRAVSDVRAAAGSSRLPAASPKARRMARDLGVDVAAVSGTGRGGAVVASDVLAARAAAVPAGGEVASAAGPEIVTPSAAWLRMAERMAKSWTTVPHFFLLREVNASRLVTWREAWRRRFEAEVTYTDLLVMLVAAALRQHRRLNATWDGGTIRVHPEINIGVAVATTEALVVPVIHKADTLTLPEIAARLRAAVGRAQTGTLRPEDVRGGTFTITNLGMYGVDGFAAIVNAPQAAILAVGRIAERVVAVGGVPRVQPTMMMCLSGDHRAVDGARAAQFLQTLADLAEEPLTILGGR
jgi:pyruvate dehydrogenase E2 component (dihydrolipoamide acetyltransferase)